MDTMNALVWKGNGVLSLERRPVPELKEPRDAIVRVTRSTICTSDLHIRNGAVPRAKPGVVLGHEFVGVVEAVGSGIASLKPGDRVAACCETFCGDCWFCRRGYVNNCVHGGWELGCRIDGCQAELVRVPFADTGLTLIPDSLSDEDALFVGDILASGYWGAELCRFRPGDTAVVLGLGPVGLCAAQCAALHQRYRSGFDRHAFLLGMARTPAAAAWGLPEACALDGRLEMRAELVQQGDGAALYTLEAGYTPTAPGEASRSARWEVRTGLCPYDGRFRAERLRRRYEELFQCLYRGGAA